MDEGLRLHLALCKVAERLAGVMEGARLERRDGYVLMTFPTLPIPSFNGVWPEDDSAAGALRDTITEIEATGIGAGVLARSGKMPAVEPGKAETPTEPEAAKAAVPVEPSGEAPKTEATREAAAAQSIKEGAPNAEGGG